jgi:hypothetical protein
MAVNSKQRIIERLEDVPEEKLGSMLDYVEFLSAQHYGWLDPSPLTERELELVQEALDDPRPDVPDSEVRKMLGM